MEFVIHQREMEIIPAIDLLDGTCVRLNQGNYEKVTEFNTDPVAQALDWQSQGAKCLHLVDLDGAKTGKPVNDTIIQKIKEAIDIPIQLGGGIRTLKRAEDLLNYGLDRIILGTIAIEEPGIVKDLACQNPNQIVVGIDAKNGKVATRGWLTQSNIEATELAKEFEGAGIAAIISTDIETDGTLNGPNLKALREISKSTSIPVIASGGVGCIADLISLLTLEQYGVKGVIVGRALYDGEIDLGEASKAIMTKPNPEPPESTILNA